MATIGDVTPCLWFDTQAEEAARFYVSMLGGEIGAIGRYGKSDHPAHVGREGTVLMVSFTLAGRPFTALNGGPQFHHSPAVSFQLYCDSQDEIDRLWEGLGAGGDPAAQQCGWLADRYGVSWQIVPSMIPALMSGPDKARVDRVMQAVMAMVKPDIATLLAAAAG